MRQAITALVGSLGTLAYTRFLQPEDLGAFTLALIVYSGLLLLVQIPFRDTVVYYQKQEIDHASASFWLLMGFALVAITLVITLAGLVGQVYDSPLAAPLTRAITIAFFFQAIAVVPAAVMLRQFRFAVIESIGALSFIIVLIGWIALAPRGYGAWTLVYPQIIGGGFYAFAVWLFAGFRPQRGIGWETYRDVLRYSRSLLGSKLTIYLQRNLDNAVIGRFGTQALGWYSFGEDQSAAFVLGIGHTISQITLPALASVKENMIAVRRILTDMFRLAASTAFPGHVGAYILAEVGVRLLFGEQWLGGVAVFQAYLVFRAIETIAVICDAATSSLGQPQIRFQIDLIQLPFFALGVFIGLQLGQGVVGIAWLLAGIRGVAMAIYIRRTLRATGLPLQAFWRQLWPAIGGALAMGLVVNELANRVPWESKPGARISLPWIADRGGGRGLSARIVWSGSGRFSRHLLARDRYPHPGTVAPCSIPVSSAHSSAYTEEFGRGLTRISAHFWKNSEFICAIRVKLSNTKKPGVFPDFFAFNQSS